MTAAILPRRYCQRIASEVAAGINLGLAESQALVRSHEAMRDLLTRIASNTATVMPLDLRRETKEAAR